MSKILELYGTTGPKTGQIDSKAKDKTPISPDGGLNLATDDKKILKARGGSLNEKKYSDSVKR